MISQETIDRIFEAARIEEVVGDFVELKKAGVNFKGNCPFHDEKTPSFVVSPTKGIYKCFGCGKGGNSIVFIQEIQSATYPEALRYVAEKYNIEIIEEQRTQAEKMKLSAKENQFAVTNFASDFFQKSLWETEEGKAVGLAYFKERGFSTNTIKKFKLGFSPKTQNSFKKAATDSRFDLKLLIESSLVGKNDAGESYDKFRDRAIFPIHNYSGKTVGFGGRSFNSNAKAKYLNSGETLIYDKSKVLYGLNVAKQAISKANNCYVVEGYTDVISMHQNGVENVVSASGTALSPFQINLIKRSTNNIVLLFDGDKAGVEATIRSINLGLKLEINVMVISFPEGEDPDSYSKKLTTKKFKHFLETNAMNFVDYLIEIYSLRNTKDPDKVIEIKKKIIYSISEIPDAFSREEYCKIYHSKLDVSEKVLLAQVNRTRAKQTLTSIPTPKLKPITRKISSKNITAELKVESQEKELLRLLINYGNETLVLNSQQESVAGLIIAELYQDNINFINKTHQKLYTAVINFIKQDKIINIQKLTTHHDKEIREQCIDLIAQAHNISENWKNKHNIFTGREDEKLHKTTEKAILSLKKSVVDLKISKIQQQINSEPVKNDLIIKLSELTKLKTKIAKVLGRNIG